MELITIRDDDWNKLSQKQKNKVLGMKCNNWENVRVYIQNFDNRDPLRDRLLYDTLLIKFIIKGIEKQATISAQVNGK